MQKNTRRILFILIGLCAFVLGLKQLREPDVWWQLLAGRWMLEHGSVTHKDVFSITMAGQPWINVKWLYEVIIASFEKILGPECVILLQAIVNVCTVWLLYRTLQAFVKHLGKAHSLLAAAIAVLAFLAIDEYRMAGRPEMMSHLFSTLFIYIFWRNPSIEWKKVWWLIPLQCIWANMHEGYPVGIVIIGTFLAGAFVSYIITKEKTALTCAMHTALLLVACVVIILLNPNGIVLWKQPFEIYRQVWANKYTTELYSYKDAQYWTIQAKWHIGVLLLVAVYWIMQILNAVKQKQLRSFLTPLVTAYLILIPLFAYLSLTANRNIPFSQIVLFPSVPLALGWLVELSRLEAIGIYKAVSSKAVWIGIAAAALFYISVVSNKFYQFTNSPNKYGVHVSLLHNPTGAASFIRQNKIQGPAFSDYFVSSYLLWNLYPSYKSYIDLRDLDVFPVKFFDDYFSMYERPEKYTELDKRYNFNYVVVNVSQLQALQMGWYWEAGYNLIYLDPVSAIFLKQNETNKPLNSNMSLQKTYNWPAPIEDAAWAEGLTKLLNPTVSYADEDDNRQYIHAARYYSMIKNYSLAVKMLLPHMAEYEDDAEAYTQMGKTYSEYADVVKTPQERKQKLDSAYSYVEQALQFDPGYTPALSAMGVIHIMFGNYADATTNLEKFLRKDKSSDYGYFLLGFANRQLWKNGGETHYCDEVLSAMKSSVRLNPRNGKAYLYMAESYLALNKREEARDNLKLAIASGNKWTKEDDEVLGKLKKDLNLN